MYRNPILVRKISHLTDARYFAAMGVDWISMILGEEPASFMHWNALREWMEGPKLIAEIPAANEMLLAKTIIEARPDGILVADVQREDIPSSISLFMESVPPYVSQWPADAYAILHYNNEEMPASLANFDHSRIFLQADWTPGLLEPLLESGYTGGICFTGGLEEATGMRNYDTMDQLLDVLAIS